MIETKRTRTTQLSLVIPVTFLKNSDGLPVCPGVGIHTALELHSKSKTMLTLHDRPVFLFVIWPPSYET